MTKQLTILNDTATFPDPEKADAEGLVAVGGDFSLERLLAAYRRGIFPWTVQPITWWSPDPRGIIELNEFHVSQSLAKVLRQEVFQTTINTAFTEVLAACAQTGPKRKSVWITSEFIEGYTRLHQAGHAHSVECWQAGKLVGGIFGIAVGGLFSGESMFHTATNASKVALCHLVEHLRGHNFALFDIQMVTHATLPFGAKNISRHEYLQRLAEAVGRPCVF